VLDGLFHDAPREVVEARVLSWFGRYLDWKFGEVKQPDKSKVSGLSRRVVELRTMLAERGV
jgi:hypothetical protein